MNLPPWVNSAGDPADPEDETRRRLTGIESGLVALNERLDALATSVENSVREAVAKDFESVATDLRHTVSDLGRLLVRDLGRLSKILSEHRDTVVAEIRGRPLASPAKPKSPAPRTAESPPPPLVDIPEPEVSSIPVADGSDAATGGGVEAANEAGGWRTNRRRRRDT